jgi:hypothetical protein
LQLLAGPSAGTNIAGANTTVSAGASTGNAAGGSIIFQVAPAGGSGTALNSLQTALTIGTDYSLTINSSSSGNASIVLGGYSLANRPTISNGGQNTFQFAISGANVFGVNVSGNGGACLANGIPLQWSTNSSVYNATAAVALFAEASNTLALRNGTAAQALNIYNTYTSSTSFERYSIDWITTANLAIVGPNKGSGGGTQRVQRLSYLEDGGAGSTVPVLGTTCPAASATVKSWIKIITSDGTTAYIPCWA